MSDFSWPLFLGLLIVGSLGYSLVNLQLKKDFARLMLAFTMAFLLKLGAIVIVAMFAKEFFGKHMIEIISALLVVMVAEVSYLLIKSDKGQPAEVQV